MINPDGTAKLTSLARALIDQNAARILVKPQMPLSGYWFGGGNLITDHDGSLLLCGRYRNSGDSRLGVGAGERGLELAVFRAESWQAPFEKVLSFSKADLAHSGMGIVSIEGVALHRTAEGIELFLSTEKDAAYPEAIHSYQKPGAGIWSIDRIAAPDLARLDPLTIEEIVPFGRDDFGRLHCKDPWLWDTPEGDLMLGYCTHPYTWSSSGTALWRRSAGEKKFQAISHDLLRRGPVWDIAAARVTNRLAIPQIGAFANGPARSLFFYDSCECLRQLDENPAAVFRPRGYSCEEIGGIAIGDDSDLREITSLTPDAPLFISPYGTGCSRYVATLSTPEGIYATWQQSQPDLSQPSVGHFLPMSRVEEILAK